MPKFPPPGTNVGGADQSLSRERALDDRVIIARTLSLFLSSFCTVQYCTLALYYRFLANSIGKRELIELAASVLSSAVDT